jgi:peptidoglycan/LPS O-acetylase OafA/YrhL
MHSIPQNFLESAAHLEAQTQTNEKESRPNNKKRKVRSAYLDGLRGIAAVAVFNHHILGDHGTIEDNVALASSGIVGFLHAWWSRIWYMGGAAAVCFFFILTGYCLSMSTLEAVAKGRGKQCRNKLLLGALRRYPRLYLPVIAVSFLVMVLMQLPSNVHPDTLYYSRQDNFLHEMISFVIRTWEFFQPLRTPPDGSYYYAYNPPLWTIPSTVLGSLLVYMVLTFITLLPVSKRWTLPVLSCLAMILLLKAFWWESCMLFGMVLATLNSDLKPSITAEVKLCPWIATMSAYATVVTGIYLLAGPAYFGKLEIARTMPGWKWLTALIPSSYTEYNYLRFWHTCGAVLLILGLQHTPFLQKLLSNRLVQCAGRLSFMIYAVHVPVGMCTGSRLGRSLGIIPYMAEPTWFDNKLLLPDFGPLRSAVAYIALLAITFLVAHWATRYIDEPCGRLCQRIGKEQEKSGS